MTTIYLVRHGTTDDNVKGIFQGSRDTTLGKQGLLQAALLASRFKDIKIDAIYTSPLLRASMTADKIAIFHGLTPIVDQRLKEQNCGLLEGRTGRENQSLYPDIMYNMTFRPAFFCAPNGETSKQVYIRISEAINEIARNHPDSSVVVVSHGFAIQMFLSYAKGIPFEDTQCDILDNASFCTFVYDQDGKITIKEINNHRHIPEHLRFCVADGDFYET